MKRLSICGLLVVGFGLSLLSAQAPYPTIGSVLRLDAALDAIISVDAKAEVLKDDYFGFTEGGVWVRDGGAGYLLFSDMGANRVYKWSAADGFSVFLERSGFSGTTFPPANVVNNGRLNVALLGSNGMALDRQGRLILCTHGDRTLVRIEKDGTRTILADKYEGKRLNGPNDLVVKSDGSIYFSDRGSGLYGGQKSTQRELAFSSIMRWKDGKLNVLDKEPGLGETANGLAFSPDEKILYTANSGKIMKYDVRPDGTITNPRLFLDTTTDKSGPGGPDGFRVDLKGNVFTGGPGGLWIVSPAGKPLGKVLLPGATNMAFGDADGKRLYIVSRGSVYRIRLNAPAI